MFLPALLLRDLRQYRTGERLMLWTGLVVRPILELERLDDELELLDELVLRRLRDGDTPFVSDSLSVFESRLSP